VYIFKPLPALERKKQIEKACDNRGHAAMPKGRASAALATKLAMNHCLKGIPWLQFTKLDSFEILSPIDRKETPKLQDVQSVSVSVHILSLPSRIFLSDSLNCLILGLNFPNN
jgi:hypothetical protein